MEKAQHLMSVAKQMHDVAERLAGKIWRAKAGAYPVVRLSHERAALPCTSCNLRCVRFMLKEYGEILCDHVL